MALTPEDVVKKEFSKPKGFGGRNGYDDNQVDDFLDEVVAELRRLNSENESLSDQLEDCRRGVKGGDAGAKTATSASVPALTPVSSAKTDTSAADKQEIERLRRELDEAKKAASATSPANANVDDKTLADLRKKADDSSVALDVSLKRVAELEKELASCKESAKTADHTSEDAASVISLAQRLHDEHVHAGEVERDRLISEAQKRHDELLATGQSQHDELVRTGTEKSTSMIADAEKRRDNLLSDLEKQHTSIRSEIERLKAIEVEYRTHLKNYLTEEIKHLDASPKAPVVDTKN